MNQILVIDIGNTNVVVGVMADGRVLHATRIATALGEGKFETIASVKTELRELRKDHPEFRDGILSSVVPELTQAVCEVVLQITGVEMMVMGDDRLKLGMEICVENPAQVGHDRIADAIGAMSQFSCPLIIVDMGTATTVNVVDREGRFVGGMIIPGVRTSLDALSSRASQLRDVPLQLPEHLIGRNTTECMQSGVIYGAASMIDGLIDRIRAQQGSDTTVVMTGGHAHLVYPLCQHKVEYDEYLLFRGLYCIYTNSMQS